MSVLKTIEHIHGGDLWAASQAYGIQPENIIDFSANINPLGLSPTVYQALQDNLHTILHYPDPNCSKLSIALAKWLGLTHNNILFGNGAVELIYLLMNTLKPQKVLITAPTFSEYEAAVQIVGGTVVDFMLAKENNFRIDVDALCQALPGMDMLVLCNPNNPTGQLLTVTEVMKVVKAAAAQGVFVLVDEAFIDFTTDKINFSVTSKVEECPNLFIAYSLTKIFAIPGLRLGAGIGNSHLVSKLVARKDPWNVNSLAQIAGLTVLEQSSYLEQSKELVELEKNYLWRELTKIKALQPFYPSVNFILLKLLKKYNAKSLQAQLAQHNILIRDCSSFKNLDDSYIRVAVKDRANNEKLIQALQILFREGDTQ